MDRSAHPVRRALLRLLCLVVVCSFTIVLVAQRPGAAGLAAPHPEPVEGACPEPADGTRGTPINLGSFVTGAIDRPGEVDTYTFSAAAGDTLLVSVKRASGDLAPRIRLYDPLGHQLGEAGGAGEAELRLTLPAVYRISFPLLAASPAASTGDDEGRARASSPAPAAPRAYTLLVGGDESAGTGTYGLFVQRTNRPGHATPITPGETLAGAFTRAGERQTFTFAAAAGDRVQVSMARTAGRVAPALELYDPAGRLLDQARGAAQVQITGTLATTGTYTLLAGAGPAGACAGGYRLAVQPVVSVAPPAGWTWPLPFQVVQVGQALTITNFDIRAYAPRAPAAGVAYYVATGGSDANSGLDAGHPLRRVSTALQKADVGEVHIAEGVYSREAGGSWNGVEVTRTVAVYGHGQVILTGHQAGLSWAPASTLPHTYKATRSGVQRVLDASQVDGLGDYAELVKRASAEEVEANPGSWYLDGSNVLWAHTADGRAPDADIWPLIDGVGRAGGNITVYLEHLTFIGNVPFGMRATAAGQTPKLYAKDCVFKYGTPGIAGGLRIEGVAEVYLQRCLAARNAQDGFNYHALNGVIPKAVEIGCVGRDNGTADGIDNDNGSSIHDDGDVFRLGGAYYRNVGPNAIDIGGARSWNLGCLAYDSAALAASEGFHTAGEMWLDGCRAWGNGTDVMAEAGCALHQRGTTFDTVGGKGTIDGY